MIITQNSRISHHTLTGVGMTFSVPLQEDFTLRGSTVSWTSTDLALSEIGVNEYDGTAFIRVGSEIKELQFTTASTTPQTSLTETVATRTDTVEVDIANLNFGTGIKSIDGATESSILFTPSTIIVSNNTGTGIEYDVDYSSTYTNRSLVDKEYVDNSIGATPSLSDVLNTGNTTGTYSIIVEDQSALTSTSGESNILFTPVGIDISVVNMTFSNYEVNDGSLSSREIGEIGLTNSSIHLQTYYGINNGVTSTSGDRNLSVNISNDSIISNVTQPSTGFYSTISLRKHIIETYLQDADNLLSNTKFAYQHFNEVRNLTTDVWTIFNQTEDSILSSVTDNGFSYISSNELRVQNHQRRFSPTPNIFITEDKRGYWTQTLDATPQIVAYADVDPSAMVTNTSIVQVKAMVRGILSDKSLGYAAEITSWVRLDELGPTPIVQIGTIDYVIKSEFTTASSSFVISGPNMYIDVTGEIGLTIDWTCSLEIIYDKNTF